MKEKIISEKALKNKTLFAFIFFLLFLSAGAYAWTLLRKQRKDAGIQVTLRQSLLFNEKLFSATFNEDKLVKTYPISEAEKKVRVNGALGMSEQKIDTLNWRLNVLKTNGDTAFFTLDDIRRLPKTEIVFDFKCIEGWSQKTWWGGVKLSDFMKHYGLNAETQMNYAGLITPDKGYYVGIDMPSMLHPQTILCYEMNGQPLPINQGYPLRLIIPVKYGIKHLKRIGSLYFSNSRPRDYWAESGYDYYAGH